MNLCRLKLYRAYSTSFNSSNIGKFFGVEFKRTASKFRKRKSKLLSFVPVLEKTWKKAVSRCSRATTAKKCTKKRVACAKLLFSLSKPISFVPFSLLSSSSLRKLPNVFRRQQYFHLIIITAKDDIFWQKKINFLIRLVQCLLS